MKREDVLKLFPDATEDQITKMLNAYNADITAEKSKSAKAEANLNELQAKLDAAEREKMTDMEKLQKDLEASNQKVAELEKRAFLNDQRSTAIANFKITAEQASEVVKDDGTFDMVALGKIIAEKETAAALAKEQEIAKKSSNPNGGNPGSGDPKEPEDVQNAKSLVFGNVNENAAKAQDYYK